MSFYRDYTVSGQERLRKSSISSPLSNVVIADLQLCSDFVRENCWVLNFSGKHNSFVPIDQAQEHNIKDIKVTYRSEGPNINWEYIRKLHPAIPVIRALSVHMEQVFGTLTRGKKHTTPKKDVDVARLVAEFTSGQLHQHRRGRVVDEKEQIKDYYHEGMKSSVKTIEGWHKDRQYYRSSVQDFS